MSRRLVNGNHSQSDEILGQIFLEHLELATEDIIRTSDGPWVLSRVSHSWRKITLTHPELWSVSQLKGPDRNAFMVNDLWKEESGIGTLDGDLLDLALQRSQDYPLEVTLQSGMHEDGWGGMGAVTQTLHKKLILAVVAHSDRWKTANLQITNAAIPSFAPILNHLSQFTRFTICNTFEGPLRPFLYAANAPGLTDVRLINYPHELIALPWSSIRRFSEVYQGDLRRHSTLYLKTLTIVLVASSGSVAWMSRASYGSTSFNLAPRLTTDSENGGMLQLLPIYCWRLERRIYIN
ncbi:hypothetical protein DFH09DRAFT_1329537 [Mycena vulgaris]|nr:hypothetical protein DFH09DRAFT_1329537 [Mycena vulgaris]